LFLQPFNFEIIHKPGRTHHVDALSRIVYPPTAKDENDEIDEVLASLDEGSERAFPLVRDDDSFGFRTEIRCVYKSDCYQERVSKDMEEQLEQTIPGVGKTIATLEDLPTKQRECPELGRIINYIERGELPLDDKSARQTVFQANEYIIDDGTLYHVQPQKFKELRAEQPFVYQIAIPTSLRNQILQAYHDETNHEATERCFANISAKYYWPRLYTDVKIYTTSCLNCQKNRRAYNVKPAPLHPLPVHDLFECVSLDHLGPLPEVNQLNTFFLLSTIALSSL
jgi:hypothetical protein